MPFGSLWIPVLVSAVVVFVVSSLLHMLIKHHKSDHRALPDEAGVAATLRKSGVTPGLYMLPYCGDMKSMKDPAFVKKFEEGPIAHITVMPPGMPNMGKYLGMWLGFCIFVSFVTAYVARNTLHFGENGMHVWQITGAVAWAGYTLGAFQDKIWKSVPWPTTLRFVFDGTVYAVLTGLTFKLLWPAA